jgi:hypothetical protein
MYLIAASGWPPSVMRKIGPSHRPSAGLVRFPWFLGAGASAIDKLLLVRYSPEEFIPDAYCRYCGWPFKISQIKNKKCQAPNACRRRQELPLDQRNDGCPYDDRVHPEWRVQHM